MSILGADPHGDPDADPDLDEDDYDKLDEIAEESREIGALSQATTDAVKAASEAANQLDTRALILRADNVCQGKIEAPGEGFTDPYPNSAYNSLLRKATDLAGKLGFLGRRGARAQFLAYHLAFVAENHHGPTGDTVLMAVSDALTGKGKAADGIDQLASAWFHGEAKFFERMARIYAWANGLTGSDLAEHIVFMSIAANLRTNDTETFFTWDNQLQVLELAEEMAAGLTPGGEIDVAQLYTRADALVQEGHIFPPQVAEVTRLALAALAGAPDPERHPPDRKTADALERNAFKIEQGTLGEEFQGVPLKARVPVLRAAEYCLGETWSYLQARGAVELGSDKGRLKALTAALGTSIGPALTAMSDARRTGTPLDVVSKAASVQQALTTAEPNLLLIIGDVNDLKRVTQFAVEVDSLKLIYEIRGRVAELCRDVAQGTKSDAGRFDAAIAVARMQTERGIAGAAVPKKRTPGFISDAIADAKKKLPRTSQNALWSVDVANRFTAWCDAAQARRLNTEEKPDPDQPDKTVTLPGLIDATPAVAKAVAGARTAVEKSDDPNFGSRDKSLWNRSLDEGLLRISAWLRAKADFNDPLFAGVDLASLRSQVEKAVTQEVTVDDPAQAWKDGKADLIKRVPSKSSLRFNLDLRKALGAWKTAVEATPRDDDVIAAATWVVLGKLADYRAAVKRATLIDEDHAADFSALFDVIGQSVASKLESLG